jgi:DNA-binding FadR family transcriptional regulator
MTRPHVGEDGLEAHRRILKSIKAGSPEAAQSAMAKHLAEAERVWRSGPIKSRSSADQKPKTKTR